MNRDELRSGAAGGILAAAATTGTLVALGRRAGTTARPFNVVASHLLGARAADTVAWVPRVSLTGLVIHVAFTGLLGIVILGIVRNRLAPLWIASTAVALLCCLVSIGVARRGGSSLAQLFTVGDLLVYYFVFAASIAAGIRFALPASALD